MLQISELCHSVSHKRFCEISPEKTYELADLVSQIQISKAAVQDVSLPACLTVQFILVCE